MKELNDFYLNFSPTLLEVTEGIEALLQSVQTSALDWGALSTSRPGRFPPREEPRMVRIRGFFLGPKPVWTCLEMRKSATVIRSSVRPDCCLVTTLTELTGPRNIFWTVVSTHVPVEGHPSQLQQQGYLSFWHRDRPHRKMESWSISRITDFYSADFLRPQRGAPSLCHVSQQMCSSHISLYHLFISPGKSVSGSHLSLSTTT